VGRCSQEADEEKGIDVSSEKAELCWRTEKRRSGCHLSSQTDSPQGKLVNAQPGRGGIHHPKTIA